jgi:TonB family protein
LEDNMSIYWLIAAIATTPTTELPTVSVPPLVTTVYTPPPIKAPPKGEQSPAIAKSNPGTWAGSFDYPSLALREEREGITGFKLTINQEGRVSDCAIIASSGHADLDKVTCDRVTARAEFFPAQDKQGKPTSGQYANRIRWQIPSIATTASLPIEGNSLPRAPQLRNPLVLRIAKDDYPPAAKAALQQGMAVLSLDIDNAGTVRNCSITRSTTFPDLDNQSCSLAQKWQFDPARNLAGEPVAGRTSHYIHWRLPRGTVGAGGGVSGPRNNPFENSGAMTMTLDFNKEGKLSDCVIEHKGELPIFGSPAGLTENMCKSGMQRGDIKPFVDANGNPKARRVIMKISVDHADVPAAAPKEQ